MIKNNRLDALVLQTKGIDTLLDIGCDHGLVILKAFENDYIKKAIASDINVEPLNSARKNLTDYSVEFVLGDGFKKVSSKFDGVVIAGMGANLISNILIDAPTDNNITYILQANNKYENLRFFLSNNNYKIIDEEIVFDKHYYIIIKAVRGKQVLSTEEIFLGPILMKKASSINYYKHMENHYKKLISKEKFINEQISAKYNIISTYIDKIK